MTTIEAVTRSRPSAALVWLTLAAFAVFGAAGETRADDDPIVQIDGRIGIDAERIDFRRSSLEALGLARIVTTTPWDDGEIVYEGVSLGRLMEEVAADASHAYVVALNDYMSVIPVSDFEDFGPILATRRNGVPMPVAEKGPFFIVYPFSERPELRNETCHARAVWQVARITFE